MIDYKSKIKNLHYETQLLESLEWDTDQLEALFEYVDNVFSHEILIYPEEILNEVANNFGESTKQCLKQIFNEITVSYNLHMMESTDEH